MEYRIDLTDEALDIPSGTKVRDDLRPLRRD